MAGDHALTVLSGIIPSRRDFLLTAIAQLQPEHFRQPEQRNLFVLLDRYYQLTGEIMTDAAFDDLLERQGTDLARRLNYVELYRAAAAAHVLDHEFKYAIDALKDIRSQQLTGEVIVTAMEVLERGHQPAKGPMLKGHRDARDFLYAQLATIDRLNGTANQAPAGDVRYDKKEILQEYADRKSGKITAGITLGIPAIDMVTMGVLPGELTVIAAYTGEGKTQLCCQTAWHVATQLGKNVFFVTSETLRAQVRRRILARHSRLEMFGVPGGLDSSDIKNGSIPPEHEQAFFNVIDDFTNNPSYGKLNVVQIPRGATLGLVEARLTRAAQEDSYALCIIDYLALLQSDRSRQTKREEYNEVIKDAKVMAVTHDDGRGIPVISPWHTAQAKWNEAVRRGEYVLGDLGETSEIEKSADGVYSLLYSADTPSEVKFQFLKLRDAEIGQPIQLEKDYKNSYMSTKSTASSVSSLLDEMSA